MVTEHVLKAGTTLSNGAYTILGKISGGGFSITYLAQNRLNVKVVIKELYLSGHSVRESGGNAVSVQHISEPEYNHIRRRFSEEGLMLTQLQHANIVRAFDLFEENNTVYLVLEYIEGQTLEEKVRSKGAPLQEYEILNLIGQIADALSYIHSMHFYHRDIKPSNIMVTPEGKAMLIDFGISKVINQSVSMTATVAYSMHYSPLEQRAPRAVPSAQTDVFGLAATMYYCSTSVDPADVTEWLGHPPSYPDAFNPHLSYHFSQTIMQGMALYPGDRPISVRDFWDLLTRPSALRVTQRIDKPAPVVIGSDHLDNTLPPMQAKRKRSVRAAVLIFLLLGAGLATGSILGGRQGKTSEKQASLAKLAKTTPAAPIQPQQVALPPVLYQKPEQKDNKPATPGIPGVWRTKLGDLSARYTFHKNQQFVLEAKGVEDGITFIIKMSGPWKRTGDQLSQTFAKISLWVEHEGKRYDFSRLDEYPELAGEMTEADQRNIWMINGIFRKLEGTTVDYSILSLSERMLTWSHKGEQSTLYRS